MPNKLLPIAFSTMMVDAITELRKTTTRRTSGLNVVNECPEQWQLSPVKKQTCRLFKGVNPNPIKTFYTFVNILTQELVELTCPFGEVRDEPIMTDILWVREEHKVWFSKDGKTVFCEFKDGTINTFYYKELSLNLIRKLQKRKTLGKWQRARFLPKELARIFLQITGIRAERLQDISEKDASAEGIRFRVTAVKPYESVYQIPNRPNFYPTASNAFKNLWALINGADSWRANPWVWVIDFKQIEKPKI